jgi:hypothetical protein
LLESRDIGVDMGNLGLMASELAKQRQKRLEAAKKSAVSAPRSKPKSLYYKCSNHNVDRINDIEQAAVGIGPVGVVGMFSYDCCSIIINHICYLLSKWLFIDVSKEQLECYDLKR